jgi:preprotein translocase subunit SecF
MLIGYSVDADILLTTRVIRHKEGTLNERIWGAFKTGITMTLTAIVAVGIALIFTYSLSPILAQMFTIILIGLCFDILNCWITNASILKWYGEAKHI